MQNLIKRINAVAEEELVDLLVDQEVLVKGHKSISHVLQVIDSNTYAILASNGSRIIKTRSALAVMYKLHWTFGLVNADSVVMCDAIKKLNNLE